ESMNRRVFRGIPASGGVGVGGVVLLDQRGPMFRRHHVSQGGVAAEVARLRQAITASRKEIEEVRESLPQEHQAEYGLILDAHLMMHRDELVVDMAVRTIESDGINAEWALRRTVDGLRSQLRLAGSDYFRERADDVEHVAQHILRHLTGTADVVTPIHGPSVVIGRDLSPADAARLLGSEVQGVVTLYGSATSHTAILARTLEIPAVVGVAGLLQLVAAGDTAIVDGLHGDVIIHPSVSEAQQARDRGERYRQFTSRLRAMRDAPCATVDGEEVTLLANVELPAEAALAANEGAAGIGLYRTEFLYLDRPELPSEEEQLQVYTDVIHVMGERPVVFRTFDLGADKLPSKDRVPLSPNPALGLRALRLSLSRPDLLSAQVRAILRASVEGTVELMFPLVTTIGELRRAKSLVAQCADELDREGLPHRPVKIGVMIEVPSAALMADALAAECDFFSVGTNDLVQYALALDRGNPDVAHQAQSLDPAVLKLLNAAARAARARGIPFAMCGDMAADPVALPVVLGLGYRRLSVPIAFFGLAREIVRRLDAREAHEAAEEALDLTSAADVRDMILHRFRNDLGDLWEEQGVETARAH
ncbi:MAG: phosphoenolpyruvate--protein phosphotransferase, partial [Myxococcota bacterium]